MSDIVCVQVRYPNGELVWESLLEYRRNPPIGSYIERERPPYPEPLPWMESAWTRFRPAVVK